MEIILTVKNGKYYLEKRANNQTSRTNDQTKIHNIINSLNSNAIRATFYDKDVRLYFGNHNYLILKNYNKFFDFKLYKTVINHIDENTRVTRNVNVYNKEAIKRLAISGALAISLITTATGLAKNLFKNQSEVVSTQTSDVINKLDKKTDFGEDFYAVETSPVYKEEIKEDITLPVEIEEVELPKEYEYKTFDERIQDTIDLVHDEDINFEGIALGTNFNEYYYNRINNFSKKEAWTYYQKYGEQFGIDPYLGLAIGYTESGLNHEDTIPGGKRYNGAGVGIGQLEKPDGKNIATAFNYATGQKESVVINMENASDLETNIKITMMILQNRLYRYYNNIYATIQSYNYGPGAMSMALNAYANEKGCTVEEVLLNTSDTGWLKYVNDIHINPKKYIPGWGYSTYGNPNYLKTVLGFYIGTESLNVMADGSNIAIDLVSLETDHDVEVVDKIR